MHIQQALHSTQQPEHLVGGNRHAEKMLVQTWLSSHNRYLLIRAQSSKYNNTSCVSMYLVLRILVLCSSSLLPACLLPACHMKINCLIDYRCGRHTLPPPSTSRKDAETIQNAARIFQSVRIEAVIQKARKAVLSDIAASSVSCPEVTE